MSRFSLSCISKLLNSKTLQVLIIKKTGKSPKAFELKVFNQACKKNSAFEALKVDNKITNQIISSRYILLRYFALFELFK